MYKINRGINKDLDSNLYLSTNVYNSIIIADSHPVLVPTLEYSCSLNSKFTNTITGFRTE